jgi:peptidoglycan/LPS O-acetylase OafA/YrhL
MHDEVNHSDKGKFLNIEILRIIGCISIVFIHLFPQYLYDIFKDIELYGKLASCTGNGNKAVDMFFMISGFLFSLKLNLDRPITEFLLKKFIRLWPTLVFVILVSFLISIIGILSFKFYDNLLAILGLSGTGLVLRITGSASVFWYVSAMIWTMLLFMYLLKNYQLKTVNLIIAALIFFSYSFIIHATEGEIRGHTNTYCYVFNLGMLRALGGIGIGYFIGEFYKTFSEKIRKQVFVRHPCITT